MTFEPSRSFRRNKRVYKQIYLHGTMLITYSQMMVFMIGYQQILVHDCIAGLLANLSVRDFQEIEGRRP